MSEDEAWDNKVEVEIEIIIDLFGSGWKRFEG